MEVAWARNAPVSVAPNHQVYFNTGYKNEASAFIKLNYHLTDALSVFADAQMRIVSFHYNAKVLDIRKDTSKVDDMNWTFFNPKLGVRYMLNDKTAFYGMVGRTSREPTRSDYFQDDFATNALTKQSDVKYETVTDFEFGTNFKSKKLVLNANIFAMEFENQIVNTGQINAVGYYITTNVKSSYRRGIELDFLWKINKYVWLMNSSSFSKNKATEIAQHYSLPDYSDTAITYKNSSLALSPELIINQGIRIIPMSWLYVEANYRYVSMQYLDNSTDKNISLPEFNVIDARIGINLSKWFSYGIPTISIQCNNITSEKYSPSGTTTPYSNTISYDANGKAINGTSSLYFTAATRNVFVTLNWKF
jgi:iron complex outermembrane receptor protein